MLLSSSDSQHCEHSSSNDESDTSSSSIATAFESLEPAQPINAGPLVIALIPFDEEQKEFFLSHIADNEFVPLVLEGFIQPIG